MYVWPFAYLLWNVCLKLLSYHTLMHMESRKMVLKDLFAGWPWKNRHREQTYGHGGGKEGERVTWKRTIPRVKYVVVVQSPSPVRLCDPMDCSMPGLPVPHHLPEFSQVHVHRIGAAVQLSHPLRPLLPLPPRLSQHQELLHQNTSASALPVNNQRWSPLRLTGLISLLSKGLRGFFFSIMVSGHQFLGILPYLRSSYHNWTWLLGRP